MAWDTVERVGKLLHRHWAYQSGAGRGRPEGANASRQIIRFSGFGAQVLRCSGLTVEELKDMVGGVEGVGFTLFLFEGRVV